MPSARTDEMLYRAAQLYYLEGYSQSQVSAAVGISRSNVSRMLTEARRRRIVTINVEDPSGRARDLEALLVDRFPVREARVLASSEGDPPIDRVGRLAADWLMNHLPDSGSLALSWGGAVSAVVDAMPDGLAHPEIEVLPLVGGLSDANAVAAEANGLVRRLADKLGAAHRLLHAPAVLGSAATRDALVREPSIAGVLHDAAGARVAVVGMGRVGIGASQAIIDAMDFDADDARAFAGSGAVGDCCTRFFDARGGACASPADDRVIAVSLADLVSIPTVIGVAAGAEKADAMRAALTGGLFGVAVMDETLASAVLAER